MAYPEVPEFEALASQIRLYVQLKHEYGAAQMEPFLRDAERSLKRALGGIRRLPVDQELARKEPNRLADIRKLRPRGPRRIWDEIGPG